MADHVTNAESIAATWFDGHSSQRRAAQLMIDAHTLVMTPLDQSLAKQRYPLEALRLGEAWLDCERPLQLPDGGCLWLNEAAVPSLAPQLRQARPTLAQRLSASWVGALACLVCLLTLLIWFDRQGAGLAAQSMLAVMPRSVDQKVGELVDAKLDELGFVTSMLPMNRQRRIKAEFAEAAQRVAPGIAVKLEFLRYEDSAGFNAFAMPHGGIVVLDGLAESLSDEELMAVLGHELGHVVHRHSMQAVLRNFGLFAVASVAFTDFSSVAATAAGTIQGLRYRREAEREADAFARRFVALQGLPPQTLMSVWLKFRDESRRKGSGEPPAWLSTHPGLEERLETERDQQAGR